MIKWPLGMPELLMPVKLIEPPVPLLTRKYVEFALTERLSVLPARAPAPLYVLSTDGVMVEPFICQVRFPDPSFVKTVFADPCEAGNEVVTLLILVILPELLILNCCDEP